MLLTEANIYVHLYLLKIT